MGRKVTKDEIEKWLDLKERGYTNRAIAEKYHRDEKTIAKYLKGEEGFPPDSGLESLKVEDQILERLKTFEEELNNLGIRLKAFGEDLERLRLRLNSQPDFSKFRCPKCGDYMAVDTMCVSCSQKYSFGLWSGGGRKLRKPPGS